MQETIFHAVLVIAGIAFVLRGADHLTDGAVALARRFNMSEMLIGLTIVAFGTSMPELCVSLTSAINGTADMALGNVVGSNIFNVFLIAGLCSVITPISVTKKSLRSDMPFAVLATIMLVAMLYDGTLSHVDGFFMVAVFAVYMLFMLKDAKKNGADEMADPDMQLTASAQESQEASKSAFRRFFESPCVAVPLGLFYLVLGSDIFVDHASELARMYGVSDAVVGLTILGFGTSMPELATSVVAATKGRTSMALGNVLGSCVFNVLLILGLTSAVYPLAPIGITNVDLGMMLVGMLLLWMFSRTKYTLERWEGVVLTLTFIAYMTWLLINL